MNDLTAVENPSPKDMVSFEEVAGGGQSSFVGQRLKFSKGDWLYGPNSSEMKAGTKLIALGDTIRAGWIKWVDSRPAVTHMSLLIERPFVAKRETLGDTDESIWEIGMNGTPADPWALTFEGVFRSPDDPEELYTFATSSTGGRNAMAELAKAYLSHRRMSPNQYPLVELGVSSYRHTNKTIGMVKNPQLSIIDWVPSDHVTEILAPKKK